MDERDAATIRTADRPGDLGWMVKAHGEVYARQFGWGQGFEALVARIVADYAEDPRRADETALVAEVAGRRVGCVMVVRDDETTARLRILLVTPAARGRGAATRLIDHAIGFARERGFERMTLWTTNELDDARRLYERAGFALDDSVPGRQWGRDVTEQTMSRPI